MLIRKFFIPNIKTDRNWITLNTGECFDHSIVFIHSNINIEEKYDYLKEYKDLILVCSQKSTQAKVRKYGHAIYLPLSIDTEYIKTFKRPKTKNSCYAGRADKIYSDRLKGIVGVDYIANLTHDGLLEKIAEYKNVYAVGLTALEARCLGCRILPYDPRFPDANVWKVRDCRDMVKVLQNKIDRIDNVIDKENKSKFPLIIDTTHPNYIKKRSELKAGQFNGAYYYSKEIVKNIIPNVKTKRAWDTLGMKAIGTFDHALVFIHHNIDMDRVYEWLKDYDDLILITSSPFTQEWAVKAGYKAIYLPLSIDTEYVKKFKRRKTKDTCFCGNIWSFRKDEIAETIPDDVDFQPKDICREDLLKFMAQYKKVYAIGRCALEAKCLGAEILQCYKKFDVNHWKLLDNKEAAKILQKELDKIDGIDNKK